MRPAQEGRDHLPPATRSYTTAMLIELTPHSAEIIAHEQKQHGAISPEHLLPFVIQYDVDSDLVSIVAVFHGARSNTSDNLQGPRLTPSPP